MNIEFTLPLKISVSKNKDFIINLNNYRNAHYRQLNDAKKNFKAIVLDAKIPRLNYPFEKIQVEYFYFPASNRKYDSMNVVSIVDKFFMDALVCKGVIKDDNYKIVKFPLFHSMPPDKENPRMVAIVHRL